MTDIHKAIERTRSQVRRLKVQAPHLFPEWQRVEAARRALQAAQAEMRAAKAAWGAVGASDGRR